MGTPEFAVPALKKLINSIYFPSLIVCAEDKPQGRGLKLKPPPVKIFAMQNNIPFIQPKSLRNPMVQEDLRKYEPDIIIVCAYGKILPSEVLKIPPLGCINIHPSLLPKYRGAAPIQWAIINCENETGVTIMKLDEGMDRGPIIRQKKIPIENDDTAESLHNKLSQTGGDLLIEVIKDIEKGDFTIIEQDHSIATYAPKLEKEHGFLKWEEGAKKIHSFVRGVYPWPGGWTLLKGKVLKIFPFKNYKIVENPPLPQGMIVELSEDYISISCGDGVVFIEEVQFEGRARMKVGDFQRGFKLETGIILGR